VSTQAAVDEAARGLGDPAPIDAIPLRLERAEWEAIAAGLVQRVRALEAFLRAPDLALVGDSHYFEPVPAPPPKRHLAITGHDLVRDRDGRWWVVEDNVRTPGLLYGVAARHAVAAAGAAPPAPGLDEALGQAIRTALRDASPRPDPHIVVLCDADASSQNRFELDALARLAGIDVVTHADLRVRGGRLWHGDDAVDVLWHRTAEDRLVGPLGALLLETLGSLAVVNHPGSGIADDKRTGQAVPGLIRTLLGEAPLLDVPPAPPTAEGAVLKARTSAGGRGVVVDPATPPDDPSQHIVQAKVDVAPEPVSGGERRAVDLRAHVLVGDHDVCVVPSAARYGAAGEARVNASQGGGVKAVWIV
jgi:glutamate---cysteine ligase / carboxylate-amine ligase